MHSENKEILMEALAAINKNNKIRAEMEVYIYYALPQILPIEVADNQVTLCKYFK